MFSSSVLEKITENFHFDTIAETATMNSPELFLAGEEDDFGFEVFQVDDSEWELVYPDSDSFDPDAGLASPSAMDEVLPALSLSTDVPPFHDNTDQRFNRAGNPVPDLSHLILAVTEYCEQLQNQSDDCEEDDDTGGGEDEDDDDDGLDDELVPRHLRGKLGRQRMRKLGKRACSKMNTSKRSPHLYVKAGCLYGKHGLGLKHSLC